MELSWESDAIELSDGFMVDIGGMMDREIERVCAERQITVIDKLAVSTAFHRIINAPAMRIAKLESQLAAQASAVDNLIQAGQLLYVSLSYFHDMPSVLPSAHQGNSIAERKWREALAALVNGQEGKEER